MLVFLSNWIKPNNAKKVVYRKEESFYYRKEIDWDKEEQTSTFMDLKVPRIIHFVDIVGSGTLNHRQACAVESAVIHNQHYEIYVHLNLNDSSVENDPLLTSLKKVYEVNLLDLDAKQVFSDTPAESLMTEDKVTDRNVYQQYLRSDLVNLLTVYRYGGIYLDLDVVVLKSLEGFQNFVVLKSETEFGNGVYGFSKHHPFVQHCLNDLFINNNLNDVEYNGAERLTKNLLQFCQLNQYKPINYFAQLHCDINMLPTLAAYEISYEERDAFYETDSSEINFLMVRLSPSLLTHTWNFSTAFENRQTRFGDQTLYEILIKDNCPVVYADLVRRNIPFF